MLTKYRQFSLLPSTAKPFMVQVQDLITLARESYQIDDFSAIDNCLLKAIIEVREREIDRLVSKKQDYNFKILSLLNKLMFSIPYDRVTLSHREFLPVISSLDKSTALKNRHSCPY